MDNNDSSTSASAVETAELEDITIKVSPVLYRAYQRCTWVIVNETGKDQLEKHAAGVSIPVKPMPSGEA